MNPKRRRNRLELTGLLAASLMAQACGPNGFRPVETGLSQSLRTVYAASKVEVHAAGEAGAILFFDGEGVTNTSTDADPGPRVPNYYGIGAGGGRLRVVGDNGLVLKKQGNNYVYEDSRTNRRLLTFLQATPGLAYVGGEGGYVAQSVGGGRWERVDVNAPGDAKITGAFSTGHSSLIFTTDQGAIIERDRENAFTVTTITTETSTIPLPIFGVWSSSSAQDLYAVALGGRIFRRPAGETEWQRQESPVNQDLYSISGSAPDRIFAVGARGTIVQWDGESWNNVPSGTAKDLYSVHATADGQSVVAVGAGGAMVLLEEE
jgi:photosystem II stability/assembly factor-like uncharacterized protein